MTFIDEFITTGKLGNIELGVSREYIESILGKPDDISKNKNPIILKYGSLQLAFQKSGPILGYLLEHIHLYFDEDFVIPKSLGVEGWIPSCKMNMNHFLEHMEKKEIVLLEDPALSFTYQKAYKSKVSVSILFTEDGEGFVLDSFHISG